MTPADILTKAIAAGLTIWPEGTDKLHVKGPSAVRDRWVPLIKEHKAALIRHLWVEHLRDHFEERAAILEHEAGLSQQDAEEQARRATGLLACATGVTWSMLREAVGDPSLPDTATPVLRSPYPLPEWALSADGRPCKQGTYRDASKKPENRR